MLKWNKIIELLWDKVEDSWVFVFGESAPLETVWLINLFHKSTIFFI